ncbi:phosphodiesterase [Chelatococcus sp. SYSU_G07232]|uniref:Phosphodiesterase n=1 Tax=Chelatococcus albus TaxID=3047466 RepID=A0ABT7AJ53_9HYPH|nr:phosphodiesterase [Chelatococcus sp. SYSU_G07232]MDJ1159406.1 phosphodiesterase [Chelatococcus sp. SYSU_G07232]
MLIAQITDLHIATDAHRAYGLVDTHAFAERIVHAVAALEPRPDVVLITGDVVDRGEAAEYARAAALMARLSMPAYVVPGNHDDRALMRRHLRRHLPPGAGHLPETGFLHYVVEDWPVRLLGLDSVVPGLSAGALCAERLAWLEDTLAAAPVQPTLLFLHHPPFDCGVPFMDRIRLHEGAAAFESIVAANPQILALVCGHHHRPMSSTFGGRPCLVTPGAAHQAALALDRPGPARITLEPPAYRLLRWNGRRLAEHMVYVEAFPAPAPTPVRAEAGAA